MEDLLKSVKAVFCLTVLAMAMISCGNKGSENKFKLIDLPENKKVEVWIDDDLFTSYFYPEQLKKPVLYPIKTASGKVITRGFPLETIPGERTDHPHHVGHWMNYGDVNGLDFWNNSSARPEEDKQLYGTIVHKEVRSIQGRKGTGSLDVVNEWRTPDGDVLLEEHTRFIFTAEGNSRMIDRITTLQALSQEVRFKDNKEGMFAVRVAGAMELPSGNYLSSERIEGEDVWGTRARWMKLYGTMEGEKVSMVIFDHPDNVGYPTYWHARGYGLFSANPLGQAVFSNGEHVLDFKLAPHESVSFKFRILIHSGKRLYQESIDNVAEEFATLQTPATE